MQIAVIKLLSVELLATVLVNDVAIASLDEPAEAVDAAALLVHVEALLGLQQLWDCSSSALVILEFKIAHEVMRVEVKLLDAEWRGNFSLIIDIIGGEKLLFGVVLKNITCSWILQITSNVSRVASLIAIISLTILKNDDVSTVISVELTQDVVDVESPIVSIRWHLDWVLLLTKVLDQLLRHEDFGLKSLILFLELLLTEHILNSFLLFLAHLSATLDASSLGF